MTLILSASSGNPQSSLSATAVLAFMGRSFPVGVCESHQSIGIDLPPFQAVFVRHGAKNFAPRSTGYSTGNPLSSSYGGPHAAA